MDLSVDDIGKQNVSLQFLPNGRQTCSSFGGELELIVGLHLIVYADYAFDNEFLDLYLKFGADINRPAISSTTCHGGLTTHS